MSADKTIVAITGRTKSGKSLACTFLAQEGYTVIDVDKFAHALYAKKKPLYKQLVKIYGEKVLDENGEINRKALRDAAFSSLKTYTRFTALVYPFLVRRLKAALDKRKAGIAILDFAVLFECGFDRMVDKIIYVTCAEDIWRRRVNASPNVSYIIKSAKFQENIPSSKKIALSDYILYNNGSKEDLKKGILEALFLIKKGKNGPAKKGKYRQNT